MDNASIPTFAIDDLSLKVLAEPVHVAGYQCDTSNSIEYRSQPGESPIAKTIARMTDQPLDFSMLQPHPAGQMASAYTDFQNLDTGDPLYRYTMGLRVTGPTPLPDDVGMATVQPGEFLTLQVPGPFHTTIPAAWDWLINLFAADTLPWVRTYSGDLEMYTFGPDPNDSICTIYVAVKDR